MSRYFVNDAPVPIPEWDDDDGVISDRAPNVIYIRARMDVATKGRVTSEMFTLGKDSQLEARLGENTTALLVHNIVRWSGPDFDGVPCTPENIRKLDPTEPHLDKVLDAIAERNKSPKAPKASATPATSTSAGATDLSTPPSPESISLQLASGPRKSPLLNATIGRLDKSENSTPIT